MLSLLSSDKYLSNYGEFTYTIQSHMSTQGSWWGLYSRLVTGWRIFAANLFLCFPRRSQLGATEKTCKYPRALENIWKYQGCLRAWNMGNPVSPEMSQAWLRALDSLRSSLRVLGSTWKNPRAGSPESAGECFRAWRVPGGPWRQLKESCCKRLGEPPGQLAGL